MEKLIPIFWLLFIAASTLIPAIAKKRREAEAKRAKAANRTKISRTDATEAAADREAAKPYFTYENTLQENSLVSEFADQPGASQELCEETAPESPETVDFNLRKAVIYTEILKPKFDE